MLVALVIGALLYFSFWWRRLFRDLSLPLQVYGRISMLATWAGVSSRRSQTPHEYMQKLSEASPDQAVTFERLGDIYARERWAPPQSQYHPTQTGEVAEVSSLWRSLQPRLFLYMLRHPHFLRTWPRALGRLWQKLFFRRSSKSKNSVTVEEEVG